MLIRTIAAVCVLALAACQPAPPKPRQMNAAEVEQMFVGMTVTGVLENGKEFKSYVERDGTIRIFGDGFADTGRYRIQPDGQMCIQYQHLRGGAEMCEIVWLKGDETYTTFPDGKPAVFIQKTRTGDRDRL